MVRPESIRDGYHIGVSQKKRKPGFGAINAVRQWLSARGSTVGSMDAADTPNVKTQNHIP